MTFVCGVRSDARCVVQIDEDLTARVNMADSQFSFLSRGRQYSPAWLAPEALLKAPAQRNLEAADMWSFAILLWELATREVTPLHPLPTP